MSNSCESPYPVRTVALGRPQGARESKWHRCSSWRRCSPVSFQMLTFHATSCSQKGEKRIGTVRLRGGPNSFCIAAQDVSMPDDLQSFRCDDIEPILVRPGGIGPYLLAEYPLDLCTQSIDIGHGRALLPVPVNDGYPLRVVAVDSIHRRDVQIRFRNTISWGDVAEDLANLFHRISRRIDNIVCLLLPEYVEKPHADLCERNGYKI